MERAKSFGKNIKTIPPADVKDQVFDVVVEAAGVKASVEQAFQLVKPGGEMISLGITGDEITRILARPTDGIVAGSGYNVHPVLIIA